MGKKYFGNICAVILSGGRSSRMKQDKSLMRFGRYDTMIKHQYEKLNGIFEDVYISAKTDKFNFLSDEKLILDNSDIFSPMVALGTIFETLKNKDKIFIITVDMPLVEPGSIVRLVEEAGYSEEQIVTAKDSMGNRHNLCGIFDISVLKNIKEALAKDIHKVNYLINSCNSKEIEFQNSKEFLNLNSFEEYEKAVKLA